MEEITKKGYAKINLALDVSTLRDDGYHEVSMVMHLVDLYDVVKIKKTHTKKIELNVDVSNLPKNENNIAVKMAKVFFDYMKECKKDVFTGLHIDIKKNIPIGAGLAGGSADGAAVLLALNTLYKANLSKEILCNLGAKVGSDVPFCITGKVAHCTGRGEIIKELNHLEEFYTIIVKPKISVSTKEAYQKIDSKKEVYHPNVDEVVRLINEKESLEKIAKHMGNTFEPFIIEQNEIVLKIKEKLEDFGAIKAMMSGSGPSVYGIFYDEDVAKEVFLKIKEIFADCNVFVARGINR